MRATREYKKQLASFFIVPILLIGCGKSSNLEMNSGTKTTQKKQTSSSSTSPLTANEVKSSSSSSSSNSSSTAATSSSANTLPSAACTATRTKLQNLKGYCTGIIQDSASYIPTCSAALSTLNDTSCTGIDARLSSFMSACSSAFTQYQSTISSQAPACMSAITAAKN